MPRLVVSADGVVDAPQRLSDAPLAPSAPKDFTPRLLTSGDGTPTSLPVVSAARASTTSSAPSDFMPRLLTSGRDGSSRPRREASTAPVSEAPVPVSESVNVASTEASVETQPEGETPARDQV
jgi:hypothetical protein